MLEPKLPAVADRLRQAREEITAFADFPDAHWRKVWSTNPVERSNREIKRAPTSSGSSPTPLHGTGFHPASCVLIRAQDEWQVRPPLSIRGIHGHARPARADRPANTI